MVDTCVITTTPDPTDADFDETTLVLTATTTATTIYAGPCLVTPITERPSGAGAAPVGQVATHRVALPLSAAVPSVGAAIVVTATADAWLRGRPMEVVAVEGGTNLVYRPLRIAGRAAGGRTLVG